MKVQRYKWAHHLDCRASAAVRRFSGHSVSRPFSSLKPSSVSFRPLSSWKLGAWNFSRRRLCGCGLNVSCTCKLSDHQCHDGSFSTTASEMRCCIGGLKWVASSAINGAMRPQPLSVIKAGCWDLLWEAFVCLRLKSQPHRHADVRAHPQSCLRLAGAMQCFRMQVTNYYW